MLTGSGCPLRRYLVAGTSFKKPVGSAHMQRSLNLCSKGVPRQTRADPTSATGFLVMPCRRRAKLANTREAGLAQPFPNVQPARQGGLHLGLCATAEPRNTIPHALLNSGEFKNGSAALCTGRVACEFASQCAKISHVFHCSWYREQREGL